MNFCNQNGELVSVVPTVVGGTVTDATSANVPFSNSTDSKTNPHFILPASDGTIVVYDAIGTEVAVSVKEGQFFPAMVHGTKASGSDPIGYSYWR